MPLPSAVSQLFNFEEIQIAGGAVFIASALLFLDAHLQNRTKL